MWEQFCTVANNADIGSGHTLGHDAIAHIFAKSDNSVRTAESPAVQSFPDAGEGARFDNGAADGHVWIHVTNVVDERLAFQGGDEGPNDAFERGIGHGQDDVARKKQRPRNGKKDVGKIVEDAFFHLDTRIIRRANSNNCDGAIFFRLEKAPRPPLGRIVGRPATENSNFMAGGKSIDNGLSHFCGGRSIGRKVEIQKKNTHDPSVQGQK